VETNETFEGRGGECISFAEFSCLFLFAEAVAEWELGKKGDWVDGGKRVL